MQVPLRVVEAHRLEAGLDGYERRRTARSSPPVLQVTAASVVTTRRESGSS
ncbi:MAG: hypothetical protein ACK52I_23055 [Pseudomonadota bacterium]